MLLRIRTPARTLRVTVPDGGNVKNLLDAVAAELRIPAASVVLTSEPAGGTRITGTAALATVGIKHGDMLFTPVDGPSSAPASAGTSAGAAAGSAAGGVTPKPATPAAASSSEFLLSSTPSKDTTGKEIEWLCTHPPHQMCTNCMPDESAVDNRKHKSFNEWIRAKRARCEHAYSAVCVNCMPPAQVSYKLRPGCTRHKPWPLGLCGDCQPPAASLKRQEYRHVDYIEIVAYDEVQRFVNWWTSRGMVEQRAAFLYGRFEPDDNFPGGLKAVVHAMYEPVQVTDGNTVTILDDPNLANVDAIAARFNLIRVGWIFTHLPRDFVISSADLRQMARLQNAHMAPDKIRSLFVTLTISVNAEGHVEPRGFMASDQAIALERDNVLGDSPDPHFCVVRKPQGRELLPEILRTDAKLGAQAVTKFEVEFLLVEVGSGRPAAAVPPVFRRSVFPIENRADEPQSTAAFKSFVKKLGNSEPLQSKLSDFHALVFLSRLLDPMTACGAADCVRDNRPLPEGTTLILQSLE